MRKLRVLSDADDVIENLIECWVNALNKTHGLSVIPDDVRSWDFQNAFPMLTKEEIYAPLYVKDVWKDLEPLGDSYYYLKKIMDDGHDLKIVTATNYHTCDVKIGRILEIFPFLTWEQFVITSHKQIIEGDILIDDGVHNLVGGKYRKVLFDQPHNRWFDEQEIGADRVYNWEQVYRIINDMAHMT